MKEIYLAGGCFWGAEKYLSLLPGVVDTSVGYANGRTENPTYEDVCHRRTGHAETVRVVYDPAKISLPFLLDRFYEAIDPVSLNRQGFDIGVQYRTGVYYVDEGDAEAVLESLARLQERRDRPVVVEAKPLEQYYPAEEYHQRYLDKNPRGYCHIGPPRMDSARRMADPAALYPLKTEEELRRGLTDTQRAVTRDGATEPPFANAYHGHFAPGIYVDVTTGQPLFLSDHKFASGCGWPSFSAPIGQELMEERADPSHGMERTEVRSRHSGAHLGHLFADGPEERGGLRYCINSAALRFVPKEQMEAAGYGYMLDLVKD